MTTSVIEPDPSAAATRRTRRRRLLSVAGVLGVALLVFVFAYFEPHKAFIDDKVDETLPGLDGVLAAGTTTGSAADGATTVAPDSTATSPTADVSVAETAVSATTDAETTDSETTDPETAGPETTAAEAASPATTGGSTTGGSTTVSPTTVAEPGNSVSASLSAAAASGQPVVLSSGEFFSGEHATTGAALVVALPDGSLVVRFEALDTSNGPDLRVVLSTDEASDSWEYADRLILDELKGNVGDQNYLLGGDVDLTKYRSVVIWCERFSVAFGAASIDVQP